MGCYALPVHGVSVCVCVLLCAHAVCTSTLNEPVGVVACVCCVSVCERMAHNQYTTWQYRTRATNARQIAATNCTRTPNRTRVVTSKLVSAMKSISKSMCYGLLWGASRGRMKHRGAFRGRMKHKEAFAPPCTYTKHQSLHTHSIMPHKGLSPLP